MAPSFDLVINGGLVVTPSEATPLNIGVSDGVVTALTDEPIVGDTTVDATGHVVLPGVVDPHVHFNAARGGVESMLAWSDDYETGTAAAAAGGVTAILDMVVQVPGQSASAQIERYRRAADRALVDYGFHVGLTWPDESTLAEIADLAASVSTSFKMFLTYPRWQIRSDLGFVHAVMDEIAAAGAILAVHCEQDEIVEWLRRPLVDPEFASDMRRHAATRPDYAEEIAIRECGALADVTGAAFYPVHVSSKRGLEAVRDLKRQSRGRIFAETAPHYLLLNESVMERDDAALFFTTPPLRSERDNEALWEGVLDGAIDWLGSDHGPHPSSTKLANASLAFGGEDDEYACPPGLPGIQFTLPLIYEEAVVKRGLELPMLARLLSQNAADALALVGKGRIALGYDADLVVVDPSSEREITRDDIRGGADYSVYESRVARGWPVTTISRGAIVFADGRVCGEPGHGRPIRRRAGA